MFPKAFRRVSPACLAACATVGTLGAVCGATTSWVTGCQAVPPPRPPAPVVMGGHLPRPPAAAPETGTPPPSPFRNPSDAAVLWRRYSNEGRLRQALARVGPSVLSLAQDAEALQRDGKPQQAQMQREKARAFLEETTERIMFPGAEPGARGRYLAKYGCAAWTDEALRVLAAQSPLVEVGAGAGKWHMALVAAHPEARIDSFDDGSAVPRPNTLQPAATAADTAGPVRRGDESVVARYHDRALFLCYPPPGPMPARCVKLYRGDTIVYVGEGVGGCNGDAALFEELESHWEVDSITELRPFVGGCERMYVLRRKSALA